MADVLGRLEPAAISGNTGSAVLVLLTIVLSYTVYEVLNMKDQMNYMCRIMVRNRNAVKINSE